MARPKGSKNKPKDNPSSGKTNALNDEQLEALTRQHAQRRAKLLADEQKSKADRMNFDRVIKSDLGPKGLANIKLLALLETPEGEATVKAEIERQAMVARWAGLQIGTQGSLFDEDRRPITERAFEEGKRAGMDGKSCEPPHAAGTEACLKWVEGWHDGQAKLGSGIKQKPTDDLVKKPGAESGPDAFDQAANKPVVEPA